MPHNIVLIEDNQILAFKIQRLLEKEGYNVVSTYTSGEAFLSNLQNISFDLAIVDIVLKGTLSGIEVAKQLKAEMPEKSLIFLTGLSDEDTLSKIKEITPECYIKKPYDDVTLLVNVKLALGKMKNKIEPSKTLDDNLVIRDSGKLFKIPVNTILFIQSDGNYINIHSKNINTIMLRKKLSYLEDKLIDYPFIRTHNRYMVNMNYVFSVSKKEVFIDTYKIPISEKYQEQLKDQFLKSVL